MYQTVTEELGKDKINNKNLRNNLIIKEIFKFQNVIIYILAFLVSTIQIRNGVAPFSIAVLAACVGNAIPIIGVFVSIILGIIATGNMNILLEFILISALYFVFVLKLKNKVAVEERNESVKTGGKVFWAVLLVMYFKNFSGEAFIYRLYMSALIGAITYVYYKVFVNGITVIENIKEKKAYSVEELIAMTVFLAVASLPFSEIKLFDLNISNIIIIFMIMFLGLKNGMMIGATAGLAISLSICLYEDTTLLQVTIFGMSGILAGLFSKFGKLGVISGVIIADVLLMYLAKGNGISIVYLKEIIIAAIALIIAPKNIRLELDDLLGKNKLLDDIKCLSQNKEVIEKLEAVTNAITEIIDNTKVEVVPEDFIEDFLDNMEKIDDNIFFEEVIDEENGIVREIGLEIQKKGVLVEKDIIEIFKTHNNYIYMQDEAIKNDLQELLRIINRTYKEFELKKIRKEEKNKLIKKANDNLKEINNAVKECKEEIVTEVKESEEEKDLVKLLNEKGYEIKACNIKDIENGKKIVEIVSDLDNIKIKDKAIVANISDIISKRLNTKISFQRDKRKTELNRYIQIYSTDEKMMLQVGISKITKEDSLVSGDSNLQMRLDDGKYVIAICDGMGSGTKAKQTSKKAIDMIENLTMAGFNKETLVNLINSSLNLYSDEDIFTSLDLMVLDLYLGKAEIIKNGACNTYIKNKKCVSKITSEDLPVGIIGDIEVNKKELDVSDGDIIVMCSDGLIDTSQNDKKDWIEGFLKNVSTNNVQKLADLILAEAVDNNMGVVHDDITVIVSKIVKKNK